MPKLVLSYFISPLDQFEIRNLISLDAPILGNLSLSLANIESYLTIAGYLIIILLLGMKSLIFSPSELSK